MHGQQKKRADLVSQTSFSHPEERNQLVAILEWLGKEAQFQYTLPLSLDSAQETNDVALLKPLKPYLYEVYFKTNQRLPNAFWEDLWKNCNRLARLTLVECPYLEDGHLLSLRNPCSALVLVVVKKCPRITHVGRLLCLYHERGSIEFPVEDIQWLGDPSKLTSLQQFKALLKIAQQKRGQCADRLHSIRDAHRTHANSLSH